MPKLTDKQEQAVKHESGNILISASAGSGKTHTMIERIKRVMLQKNVSVNQILCVTFTEKAAFEMKEKLKNALKENLNGPNRARLMREIIELSTADISTLHSFCGRLIRSYFFMVGLSPDFSIIDQSQAEVMRLECLDKVMRDYYEGDKEWFFSIVDRHESSRKDDKLRELILEIYDFYNSEPNPEEQMQADASEFTIDRVRELLVRYKNALNERVNVLISKAQECLQVFVDGGLKKGREFTENLISAMQQLVCDSDVYAVKKWENFSLKLDFERNLEPTLTFYKKRISDCRDRFKSLIERFSKHLTSEEQDLEKLKFTIIHNQNLIELVNAFSSAFTAQKREENVLDFNDLEHFALKILSDDQTRDSVREKYKYVFVDEYQDINGAQEKIIDLVSNDNLFMVGDVKQSIYGFRGCRPEFFSKKFTDMQKSGQAVVTLNHNFRSAENVINMVNTIFDFCMTDKYFGYNYKDTSRLVAGAKWATEHKGRAQLHFYHKTEKRAKENETPKVYDILNRLEQKEEADNGASSLVTKIINEERGKTYYDFKDEEYKNITLKDIVILTRGKNTEFVASLVRGLNRHGISVSSEVKENACDFPEIDLLVNALKAVDCFEQSIPLATVMKSPIGNFTNEDLVEIIRFYEDNVSLYDWSFIDAYKYYLDHAITPLRQRVIEFNEYFNKVRTLADFIGAKGVLEKLVKDNNLESWLLSLSLGQSKVSRLNKFINASIVNNRLLTVKEFLYKIDNSKEAFEFSSGIDEEDSVRVMTIHASKGLEFPVVIACGLEKTFYTEDEYGDVLLSRKYGLGTRFFDEQTRLKSETLLRGVIKEEMKADRTKEEMRLFYVATTRAMFSLHLTFEAKDDLRSSVFYGAEKFTDYLPSVLCATEYFDQDFNFINKANQTRKVLIGKADAKKASQIEKNLSFAYPYFLDCTLPLKTGVTSSIKVEDENELVHVLFEEQSPDIERGNIAHKILEHFNFNQRENFSAQIDALIENRIVTQEQVEKLNLDRIKNAINNDVFDQIKGYKLYREKQFIAGLKASEVLDVPTSETVVVQGVIDLLAIGNDGAVVIDYKYSSLDDNSLIIKYKKQLDIYSIAVQNVLGIKVNKKVIVNLFTGSIVTCD